MIKVARVNFENVKYPDFLEESWTELIRNLLDISIIKEELEGITNETTPWDFYSDMANSVDKSKHISLKSKFNLLKNLITVFYGVSETKDVVNTRNSDFKAKYGSNGAEYVQALKQYRKLSKIDLEKFTEEQEE